MKGMELLRKKIDDSGYKLQFIAEKCGLTYPGFKKKLDGETEFKVSEVMVLKDLLKLTDTEVQDIFFYQRCGLTVHKKGMDDEIS